jgi:sterol desaturase/sphingolipid hydroxylase (fatty acid hydroxylase superfamily)
MPSLRSATVSVSAKQQQDLPHPAAAGAKIHPISLNPPLSASSSSLPSSSFTRNFQAQVWVSRAAWCVVCLAVYRNVDVIDAFLDSAWNNHIKVNPLFKHDSFEPCMASLCFAVYISMWMVIDFCVPMLHVYRIQQRHRDSNAAWRGRESAIYQEALWYLLPWLVIDYFVPRRRMPSVSPTVYMLLKEISLSLIGYDFLFYVGHSVMHKYRHLFVNFHEKHHSSISVRAPDAIRHTFLDGTFDVFCSVITLNTLRAHPLSRSLFNVVAIYWIVEAHSGMNMPWMVHNIVPYNIFAGAVVHDLHHKKGNVNFQKFFTYLDYLFGSLQLKEQVKDRNMHSALLLSK